MKQVRWMVLIAFMAILSACGAQVPATPTVEQFRPFNIPAIDKLRRISERK